MAPCLEAFAASEMHDSLQSIRPSPPLWVVLGAAVARRLPLGRYRFIQTVALPQKPFWMQTKAAQGGHSFVCDLRDGISREVCFTGQYEPQETALVRQFLRPGYVFVDVGANWGYFSLLAGGLVGPTGRVLSLEPDPRMFALLCANFKRNHMANATPLQVAAADTVGNIKLVGFDESGGNWGITRLAIGVSPGNVIEAASETIDRLLMQLEIERVDLLKMDIEGAEALAIAGMQESLGNHRIKRLLLELHPQQLIEQGDSAERVIETLQAFGYRGWAIDHSPGATRRAAYARAGHIPYVLHPLRAGRSLDAWPHLLWLAPEVESL